MNVQLDVSLALTLNVKFLGDGILKYSPQKTGFDISSKFAPMETICKKCQILFSGKNKKNVTNMLSAELAKRVVKLKKSLLGRLVVNVFKENNLQHALEGTGR